MTKRGRLRYLRLGTGTQDKQVPLNFMTPDFKDKVQAYEWSPEEQELAQELEAALDPHGSEASVEAREVNGALVVEETLAQLSGGLLPEVQGSPEGTQAGREEGPLAPTPPRLPSTAERSTRILGKFFTPVSLDGKDKIVHFTRREVEVIDAFLEIGSKKETAQHLGMAVSTLNKILSRGAVKAIIAERKKEAAVAERFNSGSIKAKILKLAMGIEKGDKNQIAALKLAKEMFGELEGGKWGGLPPGTEIGVVIRRAKE